MPCTGSVSVPSRSKSTVEYFIQRSPRKYERPRLAGRIVLPFFLHGNDDKNKDRDHVGEHFVKLLHREIHAGRDEHMENVQSAEEERSENADVRTPHGEDNERDSEPAAVTEAVIGPYAAGIVHHVIESAETGDHAAGAGGDIFIFCDVDARRVRRVGVFAHGTKLEADARAAPGYTRR